MTEEADMSPTRPFLNHGRIAIAAGACTLFLISGANFAQSRRAVPPPVQSAPVFVTLGTNAGAIPSATRMQPSNVLMVGDDAILIDAGDGVSEQLAAAGIGLREVNHILLSHLHFDHIGGLFAVIGQRFQMAETSGLSVFGPTGTKALVDSLCIGVRSAASSSDLGFYGGKPCDNISVTEIGDGSSFALDTSRISVAANTHYSASGNPAGAVSLSFRFDMPGRSIVYTGDTGPSSAVERLAKGADLLVTEIIDPDRELANVMAKVSKPTPALREQVSAHFRLDHLSAAQAAWLAKRAGVGKLVLTHSTLGEDEIPQAQRTIAEIYPGPVAFARDLDRF